MAKANTSSVSPPTEMNLGVLELTLPAHMDGCYETPDLSEHSFYTLHLYLNDSTQGKIGGGATTFRTYLNLSYLYSGSRKILLKLNLAHPPITALYYHHKTQS